MRKISLLVLFLTSCIASYAQWTWLNPLPEGNPLTSIYFYNANSGCAVGNAGAILKTINSGITWTAISSGTNLNLNSVYFTDNSNGYVVGGSGTILKTTDGGSTWQALTSGTSWELNSVYFTDINNGYAVGGLGIALKTTNAGNTWTTLSNVPKKWLQSAYFINKDTGYVVGNDGTLIETKNGGTTWDSLPCKPTYLLTSVRFANKNIGYAVGKNEFGRGLIIKTVNGGATWDSLPSGTNSSLNSIYLANADTGYVVGYPGIILKTTNGGAAWSKLSSGTTDGIISIFFTSPSTGYAVGQNILKTSNDGDNWTSLLHGTTDQLTSVFFTNGRTGYVTANNSLGKGYVLRTKNGGTTWDSISDGITSALYSVYFTSADTGFLAGGGILCKTVNGGNTWTSYSGGSWPLPNLNSIYFPNKNMGFAVGLYGTIVKTSNGGTSWDTLHSGTTQILNSVYFISADTGYAAGNSATILKTVNGGITWNPLSSGTNYDFVSIFFTDVKTGYIAPLNGEIIKTIDGGKSWLPLSSVPMTGFSEVHFLDANTGYALGMTNFGIEGIAKTSDGGATWNYSQITGNWLTSFSFPNADTGYVVGYNGSILKLVCSVKIQSLTVKNITCFGGNNGSLSITTKGGTKPYQFSINNGITFQDSNVFASLTKGNYFIITKDLNNCVSNPKLDSITQPPLISSSIVQSNITCNGSNNGSVTITASGGTKPYQFEISNQNSYQTSNIFSNLKVGNYIFNIKDANNCIYSSQTIAITENAIPKPVISSSSNILSSSVSIGNQWYFNDTVITGANNQTFVAVKSGKYTVEVTDSSNCSAISEPFNFTYTEIKREYSNRFLTVYPNPVKDELHIKLPLGIENFTISAYTLQGSLVFTQQIKLSENYINVSSLSNGYYTLKLLGKNGIYTQSFIKQ